MEKMTLDEISAAVKARNRLSGEVTSVCTDTRKIVPGCLFVALKGANFDGHSFVKTAVENGAVAALTEFQVANCPCITVEDTRKALLDLAKYYRRKFTLPLVGVTGSVGKTTTKEFIHLALSQKYKTLKNIGNMNNEIGVPITLFGLDESYGAAVIEMGMSHFGEIHRLSRVSMPTVSVITNIGFSHIENLGTQEGILKAKLEILDGMQIDSPLILNGDDKLLSKVVLDREIITCGIENESCDVRAVNVESDAFVQKFDILYNNEKYPVTLNCAGRHNILNALLAFASGISCGCDAEAMCAAFGEYSPDGLRQNIVEKKGQTVIVDCYNAAPDSMRAAFEVLKKLEPKDGGRRIAVLADMLELGDMSRELHEKVGEMAVEAGIDKIICYGDMAKYTAQRADEMGLHTGFTSDREMLAEYIVKTVKAGDVVLFKGSRGMKLEEIIKKVYDEE